MAEHNWSTIVGASRELLVSLWRTQRSARAAETKALASPARALHDGALLSSICVLLSAVLDEFTYHPKVGFHVYRSEVPSVLASLYSDLPPTLEAASTLWRVLDGLLGTRLFELEPTTEWVPDAHDTSGKSGVLRYTYPARRSIQQRDADVLQVLNIPDLEVDLIANAVDPLDAVAVVGKMPVRWITDERQVSPQFRNYGLPEGEILYAEFVAKDETYGLKGPYLSRNYFGPRLKIGTRYIYCHRDLAILRDIKTGRELRRRL